VITRIRRSVRYLVGLLVSAALLTPSIGRAQSGQIELRLDAVRAQSFSESFSMSVAAPGNAAVAYYLTPALAIDARFVGLSYNSTELPNGTSVSSTSLQLAAFLPYHFGGSRGRSGFFVAPGVAYARTSSSGGTPGSTSNSFFTWGAELGFKKAIRGNVSLRAAATYDDGDRPQTIGATGGISVFFR
jgi:Outer membrane protein beta-barrel domain